MSEENVEIVRRYYEAFASDGFDRWMEQFAEDVECSARKLDRLSRTGQPPVAETQYELSKSDAVSIRLRIGCHACSELFRP